MFVLRYESEFLDEYDTLHEAIEAVQKDYEEYLVDCDFYEQEPNEFDDFASYYSIYEEVL